MTQSNPGIDLTAAEWAVRLHERALSAQEQIEFDRWLEVDTRHRGALLRARALWSDLDRLAALAGPRNAPSVNAERDDPLSLLSVPAQRVAEEADTQTAEKPRGADLRTSPFKLRLGRDQPVRRAEHRADASPNPVNSRRRLLVAGITAALFGGSGAWWLERREATYVSKVGEIRRVTLPDGSRMVLNTSTEATVRFDKMRREIELAGGEGLFEVAKDPLRPFIVRAGSVEVRAIGTVFAVRSADERVDVTVTEGIIELVDNGASKNAVIRRVVANEHATVMETSEIRVQSLPHAEAERRLAWRDGQVDFSGESLEVAVQEINRHNRRQIVVDDPALASRPVVGLFRADDPDGFATTVAAALGAHSVVLDDAIHLRLGAAL
jgi:transmembrane sensor